MFAALLLTAAASTATVDEDVRLSGAFVDLCIRSDSAAGSVREIPFEGSPASLLNDLKGATSKKLFAVEGVESSYVIAVNFSGRSDGVARRCGIFSSKWLQGTAVKTVFARPEVAGDPEWEAASRVASRVLTVGVRYSRSLRSDIAYGTSRTPYLVLTSYDDAGHARRLEANRQVAACNAGRKPETGTCMPRSLAKANEVMRSYNGI